MYRKDLGPEECYIVDYCIEKEFFAVLFTTKLKLDKIIPLCKAWE